MADNYFVVLPDVESINTILGEVYQESGMTEEFVREASSVSCTLQFDMKGREQDCEKAIGELHGQFAASGIPGFYETRQEGKAGMFQLYGGLLFIGIYLGTLFLMATVLIIYYKQISEGYEDQERYQIMQKVGMSKKRGKNFDQESDPACILSAAWRRDSPYRSGFQGADQTAGRIWIYKYNVVSWLYRGGSSPLCGVLYRNLYSDCQRILQDRRVIVVKAGQNGTEKKIRCKYKGDRTGESAGKRLRKI